MFNSEEASLLMYEALGVHTTIPRMETHPYTESQYVINPHIKYLCPRSEYVVGVHKSCKKTLPTKEVALVLQKLPPEETKQLHYSFPNTVKENSTETWPTGITWNDNSCYVDSCLNALFTHNDYIYKWLFHCSNHTTIGSAFYAKSRKVVKELVNLIQSHLSIGKPEKRELQFLLESKDPIAFRIGKMADTDQFLECLFSELLGVLPFLNYANGSLSYMHQIYFDPAKKRRTIIDLASLFRESMQFQDLSFSNYPDPIFILQMPMDNGKLMHYKGILPNFYININIKSKFNFEKLYELVAVILLRNHHYTTYVRSDEQVWYYLDSKNTHMNARLPNLTDEISHSITAIQNNLSFKPSSHLMSIIMFSRTCLYLPSDCCKLIGNSVIKNMKP